MHLSTDHTLLDLPKDITESVEEIAVVYSVSGGSPFTHKEMIELVGAIERHVRPDYDEVLRVSSRNVPAFYYKRRRPIEYKFNLGFTPKSPPARRFVPIDYWPTLDKLSVVPHKHLFDNFYVRSDMKSLTKFFHDMQFVITNYKDIKRIHLERNDLLKNAPRHVGPDDIRAWSKRKKSGDLSDWDEIEPVRDRIANAPYGWHSILEELRHIDEDSNVELTGETSFRIEGKVDSGLWKDDKEMIWFVRNTTIMVNYNDNGETEVNIKIKRPEA